MLCLFGAKSGPVDPPILRLLQAEACDEGGLYPIQSLAFSRIWQDSPLPNSLIVSIAVNHLLIGAVGDFDPVVPLATPKRVLVVAPIVA